jgi:hypothetical protein
MSLIFGMAFSLCALLPVTADEWDNSLKEALLEAVTTQNASALEAQIRFPTWRNIVNAELLGKSIDDSL